MTRKWARTWAATTVAAAASTSLADSIPWRTAPEGAKDAVRAVAATDLSGHLQQLAARPGASHFVAQFAAPLSAEERDALSALGLDVLSYVGANAYFVGVSAGGLDVDAILRSGALTQVSPIDPITKLHPVFARGEMPDWAVVETIDSDVIIGAYALFHGDVELSTEAIGLMDIYGVAVIDVLESVNGLVIELPLSTVYALSEEDAMQWIEPALPRMGENNDSNRVITQANTVQGAPYGLTGAGVSVLVYDGGTARSTHQDFGGRLTVHDSSGQITHATHVAATIGGSGTANATYKGMAPAVTIRSYGFEYDGTGTFLYTNPGDIETDYAAAIALGADISNNSIGTNTETNGFACSIQGDYGVTDNVIDAIVRGSVSGGEPFRIVWANGNERQGSRCDVEGFGDYYSTAPPATAKNHLAIGALNSNDDSMTSFSSWGPTDDGRMKPDFSAPGCQSNGDFGVTSASSSSDTAYTALCGTSMASPTACGLAALLLQDYRAQFAGQPDPRNSTLKVLFAQNAQDRGNTGPDYQFGYGSIRIQSTVDFMRTGNFLEDVIDQGAAATFVTVVNPGDTQLKITLAWDDVPGTPNANPALVNDLDLVVRDPLGNQYFPWTLNPANPSAAAVQTTRNFRDNLEQVLVNSPMTGEWSIEVVGFSVPQGPQEFSICGGPNLAASGIRILFPGGMPTLMSPGASESFNVQFIAVTESIVPGTPTLNVSYDTGTYFEIPLLSLGGNLYEATLPPPVCGSTPQWYISVVGDESGLVTAPGDAPASAFSAEVGADVIAVDDTAEVDLGWTVGGPGDDATTGIWNRQDPVGTAAQPEDDHTAAPGVNCWVTDGRGGALGDFDIDGGQTTLTSPSMNASTLSDPYISYWRWYSNDTGATPNTDVFVIQISNNGGASWQALETVGPAGAGTGGGWILAQFRIADVIAPTSQMRLRFIASDEGSGSLVEAAIDDVQITGRECSTVLADCNGNGIVDSDDIASGRSADVNGNGTPDECDPTEPCPQDLDGDELIGLGDLSTLLEAFGTSIGDAAYNPDADFDSNGSVDLADLSELLEVFGTACP